MVLRWRYYPNIFPNRKLYYSTFTIQVSFIAEQYILVTGDMCQICLLETFGFFFCIGATIRKCQEIQCLPYAELFVLTKSVIFGVLCFYLELKSFKKIIVQSFYQPDLGP